MSVFTAFGKLSGHTVSFRNTCSNPAPALRSREKQRRQVCKDVSAHVLTSELLRVSSFRDKVHVRPQRGMLGCDRCPCLGALAVASKN